MPSASAIVGWFFLTCLVIAVLLIPLWIFIGWPGIYQCGKPSCCPFPNQTGSDCESCTAGYTGPTCTECAPGFVPERSLRRRMRGANSVNGPLPVEPGDDVGTLPVEPGDEAGVLPIVRCVRASTCPFPGQTGKDCTTCKQPGYQTLLGAREKCTNCEEGYQHVGPEPAPGEPDKRPCETAPEEPPTDEDQALQSSS
jgi:hypothetical protein